MKIQLHALSCLLIAFRSQPSCKIGVCITYIFRPDSLAYISLEHTFDDWDDGSHTLCDDMAPSTYTFVHFAVAGHLQEAPLPRFDLSFRYAVLHSASESASSEELAKVTYRPPPSASPPITEHMRPFGHLECKVDREKSQALYELAVAAGAE